MSDEKELPATERQRERFREKGQIAKSKDFTGLMTLAGAGGALLLAWSSASHSLIRLTHASLGSLHRRDVPTLVNDASSTLFTLAMGTAASAAVAGLVAGFAQTRFQVFWKSLKLDFTRLNPLPKLKETYGSLEGLFNLLLNVVKVACMGVACGGVLIAQAKYTLGPLQTSPLRTLHGPLAAVAIAGIVVFLLISVFDYALSWFRLERKMRMSHQDVRDDHKQADGDPTMKAKRRQRARDIVKNRSLRAVPTSDVIVVNPTHFAVALRYDREKMAAPRVVAKGTDRVAMKIREIAATHRVPIVSEPPLARFLHKKVKVGRSVPKEAYRAVARILAYVYRVNRQGAA